MRKQQLRGTLTKALGLALCAAFSLGSLSTEARAADVRINVNFGPPPVVIHAPPRLVYLAEPAVYVAVGIPYDLYFVGGRYYNHRGGQWFYAPGYSGPWVPARGSLLPPGLRHYSAARLHDYRDREYNRVYVTQGRNQYVDVAYGKNGKAKGRGRGRR